MAALLGLPPAKPAIEISLASRGISQGLSQTDGAQLFARASIVLGSAQIGVQWKNISSPSASGVGMLFIKGRHAFGKLQVDVRASYRVRTDATANVGAWEFAAGATRSFGRLSWRIYSEYSPDEFGQRTSLYVETGPRLELDKATQLSANAGRRTRDHGADYLSFNAGMTRIIGHGLSVDGRYYGTNRSGLGSPFRGRLVASVRFAM